MLDDNNEELCLLWIKLDLKNTVENMKHLKIHHLFGNPKITDFRNSKPKKYPADPCL